MAKRSKSKPKKTNTKHVHQPAVRHVTDAVEAAPALGWQKLDLWPLSRPKGRHYAASADRLDGTRIFLSPRIEHPDPSTFQRNKPSSLSIAAPEHAKRSADKQTRDYMGCKSRPNGNRRRKAGSGTGKKFVPWCS